MSDILPAASPATDPRNAGLIDALRFFLKSQYSGRSGGLAPAPDFSDKNTLDFTMEKALNDADGANHHLVSLASAFRRQLQKLRDTAFPSRAWHQAPLKSRPKPKIKATGREFDELEREVISTFVHLKINQADHR